MRPIVIYHKGCDDGFGAAWLAWRKFGDKADYHAADHGSDPPDVSGRDVFIVDFSYRRPVLIRMAKMARYITVLDHHKTARDDLVELPDNVRATFHMGKSGARLTWEFFHPGETVPRVVLHIEDRDLWRHALPDTRAFSLALRSYPRNFDTWTKLAQNVDQLIAEGKVLERFYDQKLAEVRDHAFERNIAGHTVPVCNAPYFLASDLANELSSGKPFAAVFFERPLDVQYELRSKPDGVDVSEIAKHFDGGGHKHAAGFRVPKPRHADPKGLLGGSIDPLLGP